METYIEQKPSPFLSGDDYMLIEQAASGNQATFESLVNRYRLDLLKFISAYTGNSEQAEDLVQEVFLQLYVSLSWLQQHLASQYTDKPLRAWLFRVAVNRCIDKRRRKRFPSFSELAYNAGEDGLEDLIDPSPLPEEVAEQHDLQATLAMAIKHLPVKFRMIVVLRYTEELSFQEIGQRLHMPTNTVKTYFQRARPLLQASLSTLRSGRTSARQAHRPNVCHIRR